MAGDFFLKIDLVDGESADRFHKGEIEIVSFNWGEEMSIAGGGGGG